jgi:hypothetical protein
MNCPDLICLKIADRRAEAVAWRQARGGHCGQPVEHVEASPASCDCHSAGSQATKAIGPHC